jgi:hypothetical protein
MNQKIIPRLITITLTVLVILLLGWFLYKNWAEISAFPWRINYWYLALTIIFNSLAVAVTFWVWQLMTNRLGGFNDTRSGFRLYYISALTKRLPTSLPMIGGRILLYNQVGMNSAATLNCILLESILVGIAGIIVFLIFFPFYTAVPPGVATLMLITGIVLVGIFIWKPQILIDLTNWLAIRWKKQKLTSVPNRKDILLWIGIYTLPWILGGLSLYCVPRAVADISAPPLIDAIGISTLANLVSLLAMLLPINFGLKELTSAAMMTAWMPMSTALIITIIHRLILTANDILWAIGAQLLPHHPKTNQAAANNEQN